MRERAREERERGLRPHERGSRERERRGRRGAMLIEKKRRRTARERDGAHWQRHRQEHLQRERESERESARPRGGFFLFVVGLRRVWFARARVRAHHTSVWPDRCACVAARAQAATVCGVSVGERSELYNYLNSSTRDIMQKLSRGLVGCGPAGRIQRFADKGGICHV